MKVGGGLRWRIEATGKLCQRLLLLILGPMEGVVLTEGCGTGVRRGFLETDGVRTI